MDRLFVNTILFATCFLISFSCVGDKSMGKEPSIVTEPTTLHGSSFLKGKVSAITNSDEYGVDSTSFVYNENGHLVKTIFYSKGKEDGCCKYYYDGSNSVTLHYYDNNEKEVSYTVIEYDDRKNITLRRDYGYIYPDTTRMVLLYLKQNSYDNKNHPDVAFEYFCDGIPPYKYRYTYNSDGTEIEECFLAVTGDIYTITKNKRDAMGNVVEQSENMPSDSHDWTNITIDYKYDEKGNWVERKIVDAAPEGYRNNYTKRSIYYLDE